MMTRECKDGFIDAHAVTLQYIHVCTRVLGIATCTELYGQSHVDIVIIHAI